MKYVLLLLLILSAPVLAQEFRHEGRDGYLATREEWFRVMSAREAASTTAQATEASFTFTRKLTGATQQAADRKLAAYLAAYAESKGKSGLCVVAGNGACLSVAGAIVYDLALVTAAIEAILTKEIDDAARDRFKGPKLEDARKKADEDFDKEDKPQPIAPAPRSVPRRRR